jgi:uncharacterized protein (TIGR00297 family)
MPSEIAAYTDLTRWIIGVAGAIAIALLAVRLWALSLSGALAAIVLGSVVTGGGGWWAGLLLIAFFASSTLLSRIGADRTIVSTARGNRRDAVQVLANGGVALLAAVGHAVTQDAMWLVALAGSLAAANADTWSTEIGRTSPSPPRLITSGRRVPAGTSGAVSARGLAAALGGSALIAFLAATGIAAGWMPDPSGSGTAFLAVAVGGVVGSLVDSLLGATVQARRWCDTCGKATERAIHRCGTRTRPGGGLRWVTNDVVNAACIASGALVAVSLAAIPG